MGLGKPSKSRDYANYLLGLGLGLIIGSLSIRGAEDSFPTAAVVFGVVFGLLGIFIYFWTKNE